MARKKRMESIGFYHIVNRGVERRKIYMDEEDHLRYLEILQESSEVYNFRVYAYALMGNHYHLLIKTTAINLSLLMRQINAQYSMYFNKKYKRVGPLWQGRFKSWYVHDITYLRTLVKYVEHNPIKAGIRSKVGEYRWTMSSRVDTLACLNYSLIESVNLDSNLTVKELEALDIFSKVELDVVKDLIVPKTKRSLVTHFNNKSRELAIVHAIADGYTQQKISEYLGLSAVAISKIYKTYRQKVDLFNKLRDKGIFWSYSKALTYEHAGEKLCIEHLFKYGDFYDIKLGFSLFGKRTMKQVWEEEVKSDKRFVKLNFMIARVFLGMDIEASYFKEVKNARFEKLKMLAS
jgi:REP element-mobilizing transposase RayT